MEDSSQRTSQELDALRDIILGGDKSRLSALDNKINNSDEFSDHLSTVLPSALKRSSEQGDELAKVMVPTVENIVRLSIQKDINKFADALFPVIGPAIRKSIQETIRQMLQSMNHMLESTLSWQGLKWRLESIRTGIPFAQIVLLNGLQFRVEQVFLIHKESGLLLLHIEREESAHNKADLVSSMLTAISDFVKDSFKQTEDDNLGSIQVGGLELWIEQSPDLTIALAINGNAPQSLRTTMQEVIEEVQLRHVDTLNNFDGDTSRFNDSEECISKCMVAQIKQDTNRSSLKPKIIITAVVTLILLWLALSMYQSHQQSLLIKRIKAEPGYLITGIEKNGKHLQLVGLRDPLSANFSSLLAHSTIKEKNVNTAFQPYHSLEPSLHLKRIRRLIQAPVNVKLDLLDDTLLVSGYAEKTWLQELSQIQRFIPGVSETIISAVSIVDLTKLHVPSGVAIDLDLNQGILSVSGASSERWKSKLATFSQEHDAILELRTRGLKTHGEFASYAPPNTVHMEWVDEQLVVSGSAKNEWIEAFHRTTNEDGNNLNYDVSGLVNVDQLQLENTITEIEAISVLFPVRAAQPLHDDATQNVRELAAIIFDLSNLLKLRVDFEVRGHSDSTGDQKQNITLSQLRADYIASQLIESGIDAKFISAAGMKKEATQESSDVERKLNRRVTIKVRTSSL